ncbi:MAG: hypothetical protein FWD71_02300 [Oscillospiraceae bacterium]|nr:hypothetical protein [Oscillospiraceae bacterium]
MQNIDLDALRNVDIRTVDPSTLVDIQDVKIDTSLPKEERMKQYIEQIRNPYCFKCGKTIVKVSYSDTDVTFTERWESYLSSL